MASPNNKTVSLVLGSGGARGLAHIGVIHVLEEHGYEIKSISGCSIGTVVGGIYAAGKLDIFEEWISNLSRLEIIRLMDPVWGGGGIIKGEKVIDKLVRMIGDVMIEDLPITLTAVAADIRNEKEVWMNSGSLFSAMRASISLPLFLTPVRHKNAYLIDGGVLNPVPIAPTLHDDTDLIIAVNLGGPVEKEAKKPEKTELVTEKSSLLQDMMNQLTKKWSRLTSSSEKEEKNWGMYDVADQAFDAMQSTVARLKLAAYPPDVLIEIPRNACGTMEFDRAKEMIALGRKKAEAVLRELT
jgi:NTE family protein